MADNSEKANPVPTEYRGGVPYLNVKDGQKAFGARETLSFNRNDGKLAHAEMRIGDAVFMLRDEYRDYNHPSPDTLGGTPVNLLIYVPDVNAFSRQAITAGAKVVRPVEKRFHADLMVELKGPFGHSWFFATRIEDMTPDSTRRAAADANL